MTKIGVFISHSSRDEVVARLLISLVRSAINISPDDIRCPSVDGYRLPAGASINETLRTEIFCSTAFVALITLNSIESAFVLFELGARWGAQKPFLPLLTRGATAKHLKGPLSERNALNCNESGQVHQFVHDLSKILGVSPEPPCTLSESYRRNCGIQ